MVLTIDKLNLQVAELEKQHADANANLGNNVINFIMQYKDAVSQMKAKIDLVHSQIAELVNEENKAKKEKEKAKKQAEIDKDPKKALKKEELKEVK